MFTKIFWEKTLERFVRGFATAFLLTTSGLELVRGGEQFGLKERALAGLLQGVGAVALSLVGGTVGDQTNPDILPSPPDRARDSKGRYKSDAGHANNSLVLGIVVGVVALALLLLILGKL